MSSGARWISAVTGMEDSSTRRAFTANVMDGALFAFAMSFVSQQTILPVYVRAIGGGNIAVGVIPVLWTFGFNFPQVFIARHAQSVPLKKGLLLKTAIGQRIPWLLLGVVPFLLAGRESTGIVLSAFFVLYALAAIGGSINLPVWFDLIAKVTPVEVRGRLFGLRSILGSVFGIIGGGVAAYVLGRLAYPYSFALLFLFAFMAMMMSYLFLTRIEEHPAPAPVDPPGDAHPLRALPRILRTGRNYRNFLVGDALLISSTMANAFFVVHAIEKFSLSDAFAGTATVAIMVSMIFGGYLFGLLADRFGHRLNMLVSGCATLLACCTALAAPTPVLYVPAFILSASAVTLGGISRLPLIAELCSSAERPLYIAVTNMLTSPFVLAGILGGWIANTLGFDALFIIAGSIALTASFWWLTMIEEPRGQKYPVRQ